MKKYSISAHTEPHFTYNTYPTWWRRLFNRPVVKTISYYHRIRLVVESDVPLNNLKYVDGNVIGPFFEDISPSDYIKTQGREGFVVEPGATNLLINTASTFPNP
jgi:hypothetical protein